MAGMKELVRRLKAVKHLKLPGRKTGVVYKGEDGKFYTAVKSKDKENAKSPPPDIKIEDEQEQDAPKDDAKDEQNAPSEEEADEQPKDSLWDKIIDNLDKEEDKESKGQREIEALKHGNEITPPVEWMPKGIMLDGEMDNDISDEDAKQIKWQEQEKEDRERKRCSTGVGKEPGEFVAHPPPDEVQYGRLYSECSSTIEKMKDRLKFDAHPVAYRRKFIRQGAIMQDAIARSVPTSQAGFEVPNIYRRTMRRMEVEDCYIVLLADLSGSMDAWTVKRAFTVVSEACGQWVPDERFALYVFGTNFAKLKGFDEPYSKVRYRIGGLDQWMAFDGGGTVMHLPLKHILDHTKKALPDNKQKVLIVLSDWQLGGCSRTHALLTEFINRHWIVLNLSLCSDVRNAQIYPGLAMPCSSFNELPKVFFEVYKMISYEGATYRNFERLMSKSNNGELCTA